MHAWATASLYGHAPEVQVSRWGLPMITHILLSDPSLHDASENYNRAVPADEVALFSRPIRDFVGKSHRARPLSGRPIRLRYATPRAPLPIGPTV